MLLFSVLTEPQLIDKLAAGEKPGDEKAKTWR